MTVMCFLRHLGRSVSDYIHLNPARAGLLRKHSGLESFAWSSFPAFIASDRQMDPWLRRGRVFASHDLPDEGSESCRCYAKYMAFKIKALSAEESAAELEAGWKWAIE